jgi:endonuclease YncB( thermonuclease family)
MRRVAYGLLFSAWVALAAFAHRGPGRASVIDGDTIEIHGQRIRLFGIDAPEAGQTCNVDGQHYRCGQQAALALSDFIKARPVACEQRYRSLWPHGQ